MASVDAGGGEQQKGKPQQKTLRVDFTPMVDMLMLLITFFMFCTTLAKPQVMDIVMPSDEKDLKEEEKDQVKASKAITVLLGTDNKVYYYTGQITTESYSDYTVLKETDFSPKGVRSVILKLNSNAVDEIEKLKEEKANDKRMTEADFKKKSNDIKNDKETQVVMIKPTDESTYEDLVNILDEMQICSIGKYAIMDITDGDQFLIENLKTKGEHSRQNLAPKE